MKKEIQKNYKVNCMFLGQSGVGKTSIIRRLLEEDFDKDCISTLGLDLKFYKQIKFENNNEDNSEISINIWDTAGQEIFHACIKSIIHKADIIIFVRDNINENFEYWFKFVEDIIDINSIKVFYCLNKTDLMASAEKKKIINELKVINRNKNHNANILCVSSKCDDGIDNLQNLLEKESQDIISKGLEKHKYIIKIIVIGPSGIGKSSLIERIIDGSYSESKLYTIGILSKYEKVDLKNHCSINYCYYDTCGQEMHYLTWIQYLDNVDIIIFVNGKDEIKAYTHLVKTRILLQEKKIICCINKIDLVSDGEKKKVLNNFKSENSELKQQPIFLVSAKTSEGIEELKNQIKNYALDITDKIIDSSNRTNSTIDLSIENDNKKKCC